MRLPGYLVLSISVVVSLPLAEGVLTVMDVWLHAPPARPLGLSRWAFAPQSPPLTPDFVTDRLSGSRFNRPDDPNFNKQGFRDRDDFGSQSRNAGFKLLLIGDSFAYGAAAVYDGSNSGFADLLEEKIDRANPRGATVWNTGVPGIGQREELLHLKRYFPILRPHVVLLAFYANDSDENVYPPGMYYVYKDGTWAHRYVLSDGDTRTLTPEEAWRRAKGFAFAASSLPFRLRTPSFAYRALRRFATKPEANAVDKVRITKALLREISDYVSRSRSRLIVMVIPAAETTGSTAIPPQHASMMRTLQELSLSLLDMRQYMTAADYTPPPDLHWTKEAHRKVSEILFTYIATKHKTW